MNIDCDDQPIANQIKKYRLGDPSREKLNSLLTQLLKKEKEIRIYKNRQKELETAFYYNLELISERDLELRFLEEQLNCENEKLQSLITERNELENLLKAVNNKYKKKIKQLETNLSFKEEEIENLQRENVTKVNSLKKLMDDVKYQQEKIIYKMNTKFETEKQQLIDTYQKEMEEKEKYYLFEIDNLAEKLTETRLKKDELIQAEEENKNHLENLKKTFIEKEKYYLEEIRKLCNPYAERISKEIQCNFRPEVLEKKIEAQPHITTTYSQTASESEEDYSDYKQQINFLQEQNEVLKYIVKDLKKARAGSGEPVQPPGCECLQLRTQIHEMNKKFESDINNLKEILEEEQERRKEEDVAIRSLETSVTSLKDKLLSGLKARFGDIGGEDFYNHEIQNEIHIALLEEKLTKQIRALMMVTETQTKKVYEKLTELKKNWDDKLEKCHQPPSEGGSENLLENLRIEIQKLEHKIESDMRSLMRSTLNMKKCDKCENSETKRVAVTAPAIWNIFPQDNESSNVPEEPLYKTGAPQKKKVHFKIHSGG